MSTDVGFAPLTFPAMPSGRDDDAAARGHAAGYAAGRREAQAELQAMREQLAAQAQQSMDAERAALRTAADALLRSVAQLERTAAPVIEEAAAAVAAGALELAEAIVGSRVAAPEVERLVVRAMREADGGAVVVRLNPLDAAALRRDLPELDGVELVADPALLAGDTLVQLRDGVLDARIGAAVARARAALGGAA